MISIRMLKLCGDSIWKPLEIIFKNCLKEGIFPNEWKKANVVPIHKKKNDKQILSNYRPVSLLPVSSKILERLIYNSMYKHISDLLSPNQSGFRTGDSCINQLLSITYDIFHCFDEGMETRAIFLDISKAFDKVWHKGLIYKLRQYGFSGNLLALLTDFLSNRKHSSWADIKAGVPQGSILGPLLFLVYIDDLTENLHYNPKLFADDTSLLSIVADEALSNNDLKKSNDWDYKWKMSFNPDSTKPAHEVVFSRKKIFTTLRFYLITFLLSAYNFTDILG